MQEEELSRIDKMSLEDNRENYDFIVLAHVLEHTHDPADIVNRCRELLSENGVLICEVPDKRYTNVKQLYKRAPQLSYHVGYFSRRSISFLLHRSLFRAINTNYVFRSGYRGSRISSIVAVGQKSSYPNPNSGDKRPSTPREVISLLLFCVRTLAEIHNRREKDV